MLARKSWQQPGLLDSTPMHGSLFLFPLPTESATPAPASVLDVLRELEIVAQPLASGGHAAGNGFVHHVVYAGCSPHVRFSPSRPGDLDFCHVVLHGPYPHARLVTGRNTVKPRCPTCRARFDTWQNELMNWHRGALAVCANCGQAHPATALDWRQHAACGRFLIELRNVFPGEASPSDCLIGQLRKTTGSEWGYAWSGHLRD